MKNRLICAALSLCLLLCGCSGRNTVTGNELYVQSVGIDMSDGMFKCTVQVFDPVSGASTLQEQEDSITKVVTVEGATVSEALAQIPDKLGKRVFYSQNKAIVLGSSTFAHIESALDFFMRDWESGLNTRIMAARRNAAELINATFGNSINPSEQLRLAAQSGEVGGKAAKCTLLDVIKSMNDNTLGFCMPIMQIEKSGENDEAAVCTGAALFMAKKYLGEIDRMQSQMLTMLLGIASNVELSLPEHNQLSVELTSIRPTISVGTAEDENGKRVICTVELCANANVTQLSAHADAQAIKRAAEKMLGGIQAATAQKIINEYGCDPFRLLGRLAYSDRDYYEAVKGDWQQRVKYVELSCKATVTVQKMGDKRADANAVT